MGSQQHRPQRQLHVGCKAPSRSTSRLLNYSRCATSFLQTPSSAQPQPLQPAPGQPRLPPDPHTSSLLHAPSPWVCRALSRSPAHRFTCGRCDANPRYPILDQLQLLRPAPGQPTPPLDSQPATSSPAHQLLARGSTGCKGSYMGCKTPSKSTSHLLNCSRCVTSFLQTLSPARPPTSAPRTPQRQHPPHPQPLEL